MPVFNKKKFNNKKFSNKKLTQSQERCRWRDLCYQLKISHRRKTIGFQIKAGHISITVPFGLPAFHLEQALMAKYAWLQSTRQRSQQQASLDVANSKRSYEDLSLWLIWGKEKSIKWQPSRGDWYRLSAASLCLSIQFDQYHSQGRFASLQQWYQHQAYHYAKQRIAYWLPIMGIDVSRVTDLVVRKYTARWGSCSADGVIKINRLLAMAPTDVFDYVVVHELCHLQHMHHQPSFWHLVRTYCPDYQCHQQWLKSHGRILVQPLPGSTFT